MVKKGTHTEGQRLTDKKEICFNIEGSSSQEDNTDNVRTMFNLARQLDVVNMNQLKYLQACARNLSNRMEQTSK